MEEAKEYSILIADDDKLNVNVLTDILSPYYNIMIADSGNAAVKKAILDKPDLILLDIVMPKTNGFEALIKLKELDETRSIPVVFITGLKSFEDEEKGLFLGAVDYIRKPFNKSVVKARVRTQLQIVKQIRTIEQSVMVDFLLDIPNRRYFNKQLHLEWHRAVRKNYPVSLLMMDVDHFKQYNDTYGHPQGDLMLQAVARILQDIGKQSGGMVSRYGGEEFAAILHETELDAALEIAEEMRSKVEQNRVLCVDRSELTKVTISIGVASCYPVYGEEFNGLIQKMDKALYQAKNSGRNRVCHS